jgi:hypothetical protein
MWEPSKSSDLNNTLPRRFWKIVFTKCGSCSSEFQHDLPRCQKVLVSGNYKLYLSLTNVKSGTSLSINAIFVDNRKRYCRRRYKTRGEGGELGTAQVPVIIYSENGLPSLDKISNYYCSQNANTCSEGRTAICFNILELHTHSRFVSS